MSADLLARIEGDICKVGEELWNIDGPNHILDKVLERVSLLKAQLEVQKSLQTTANLLRQIPSGKGLPKQQATKVKHLIRFAFRKNTIYEREEEGRHRKLRNLDCDALKLCGLSYTTEEIVRLGDAQFGILQTRVIEFISHRNLSHLLYRPDVDKAVDFKLEDPEDDESFERFIQCNLHRGGFPKQTNADEGSTHYPTIVDTQTEMQRSGSRIAPPRTLLFQQTSIMSTAQPPQLDGLPNDHPCKATNERPSKRPRLLQNIPGNFELPGQGQYYSFSFTRRHVVENLPEPFRTGMKMSNLWKKEEETGGLAITNGLTMFLPQTRNEDTLFVARMGYHEGFNVFNLLGFGDSDVPECDEDATEEGRE